MQRTACVHVDLTQGAVEYLQLDLLDGILNALLLLRVGIINVGDGNLPCGFFRNLSGSLRTVEQSKSIGQAPLGIIMLFYVRRGLLEGKLRRQVNRSHDKMKICGLTPLVSMRYLQMKHTSKASQQTYTS